MTEEQRNKSYIHIGKARGELKNKIRSLPLFIHGKTREEQRNKSYMIQGKTGERLKNITHIHTGKNKGRSEEKKSMQGKTRKEQRNKSHINIEKEKGRNKKHYINIQFIHVGKDNR